MQRHLPMVLTVCMSVLAGIAVYLLLISQVQIVTQSVVPYRYQAGGGPCGNLVLYDRFGNKHDNLNRLRSYIGSAPLFRLTDAQLDNVSKREPQFNCIIFPETIPPTLSVQGEPYFPLIIDTSNIDSWISLGASMPFTATASITTTFSDLPLQFVVPFTTTTQLEAWFELNTTSFEFTPTNDNPRKQTIGAYDMVEGHWVLSPKESALGMQTINIHLKGEELFEHY